MVILAIFIRQLIHVDGWVMAESLRTVAFDQFLTAVERLTTAKSRSAQESRDVVEVGLSKKQRSQIAGVTRAMAEELLRETLAICRIPAPCFSEGERAKYLQASLVKRGLQEVEVDVLHNVTAVLPGTNGGGQALLLAAHIDTVFPAGTNVEPRLVGQYWRAPGIRDNSASVAITLLVPELLRRIGCRLPQDLILAFTTGEEGLGNLRGMRAVIERMAPRVREVIAVDGDLGYITHIGISVRRLEVRVTTTGGHSWADAGRPSAIHILSRIASDISRLPLPTIPKTSLNIGTFHGGTSVNAIAQEASFLLDIRSITRELVMATETRVRTIIQSEAAGSGVQVQVNVVGDRPGGAIPVDHPLMKIVFAAYREAGVRGVSASGSTDANIPLSIGIPAVAMGVSLGGRIHTVDEYLDPTTVVLGAHALALAIVDLQRG